MERARGGEETAFVEIMDRFEGKALLIARGMGANKQDAEDIAQDVFIKLFRYIRSYRSGQSFVNWFYRIVVNATRDHLRRASRGGEPLREYDAAETGGDASAFTLGVEAGSGHDASDAAEDLRRAMSCLTDREREVVILRDLQGLSAWEVSRVLRISPITVRRHASRAHERLRLYFDQQGGPQE